MKYLVNLLITIQYHIKTLIKGLLIFLKILIMILQTINTKNERVTRVINKQISKVWHFWLLTSIVSLISRENRSIKNEKGRKDLELFSGNLLSNRLAKSDTFSQFFGNTTWFSMLMNSMIKITSFSLHMFGINTTSWSDTVKAFLLND